MHCVFSHGSPIDLHCHYQNVKNKNCKNIALISHFTIHWKYRINNLFHCIWSVSFKLNLKCTRSVILWAIGVSPIFVWYFQTYSTVCELQSRLAARVFAGRHQLPSRSVMKEWIENKKQYFKENTNGKFMVLGYSQTIKLIETIVE